MRNMRSSRRSSLFLTLFTTLLGALFCVSRAEGDDVTTRSGPIIGIDLGTTYSCVAIAKSDGNIEIIPNDQGNRITPSYVSFGGRRRLVGDAAKNQATLHPTRTIFDVKRLIGRDFREESVQADRRLLPYRVAESEDGHGGLVIQVPDGEDDDDTTMNTFAPEELSAMLLSYLKGVAEAYLGVDSIDRAVITVPAYFNDAQRAATKNAGAIAGLYVERILNEPTAAAIAYGITEKQSDNDEETTILVYDLGGGTLDVTILTLDQGVFEVLATHGDTHLGGQDFDQRIMDYYLEKLTTGAQVPPRALQQLRAESERIKRTLSTQYQARLEMDDWMIGDGETIDVSELLTRAKFESLNDDLFRRTLRPVKLALEDAMLDASDMDSVVLVGGSTRIPKVQELLKEYFGDGVPLHTQLNPDEAVAYGAAVQADILSGGSNNSNSATKDLLLLDVTPLSLGTMTDGGVMTVLIKRGTTIPTEKTSDFVTVEHNQKHMIIDVYEGERSMAEDNHLLGLFEMTNLRQAPRGEVTIWITFAIDANGILEVTAEDRVTKQKENLVITPDGASSDGGTGGGRLSQKDIDRMIEDAEKYAQQDKVERERIEARNRLENVLYELSSLIRGDERVGEMEATEKKEAEATLSEEIAWFESNQGADLNAFVSHHGHLRVILSSVRASLDSIRDAFSGGDDEL